MLAIFDVFLHLDQHLNSWIGILGPWSYLFLFLILFCETGLVVTPFLPGDSLLFALGALCASENPQLTCSNIVPLLMIAVLCGDLTNYILGRRVGPKIFSREQGWLLNKKHLMETHAFYERHGGKTIIMARFIPIIRTFAPFCGRDRPDAICTLL